MTDPLNVGSFSIGGMPELQAALATSPGVAIAALAGSMWQEANDTITESKGESPVDKGTMRASAVALPPTIEGTVITVVFGYGGASQAYDVIQHERTDFHHTVGKAHFLIDPINRRYPTMEGRIGARLASTPLWLGLP